VGGAKQKLPLADFEVRTSPHKVANDLITGSRQSFRKVGYSLCSVQRNSLPVRLSAATSEKVGPSSRASRETTDWSSVCPAVSRGQHQLRVERKQLQVVNVCPTGLTEPPALAKAEGHCQSSKVHRTRQALVTRSGISGHFDLLGFVIKTGVDPNVKGSYCPVR